MDLASVAVRADAVESADLRMSRTRKWLSQGAAGGNPAGNSRVPSVSPYNFNYLREWAGAAKSKKNQKAGQQNHAALLRRAVQYFKRH
jgi:hypothetical protein